ncbi:hypothetical protein M885DRAFT_536426 [Pelagophyceae sp. CCMP2097]|nr:hypothetical protein M885DRAFT_536426 [Pelagophyceae sp. CCMP2097]
MTPAPFCLRLPLLLLCAAALNPTIDVKFINGPMGDVVSSVPSGSNLLQVADAAGVRLPRACRNGLCGSCTVDVDHGDEFREIRACSFKVSAPVGETELVVDVWRLGIKGQATMANSMKRFSDNWENEYVPDYHKGASAAENTPGAAPWATPAPRGPMNDAQEKADRNFDPAQTNLAPWDRIW